MVPARSLHPPSSKQACKLLNNIKPPSPLYQSKTQSSSSAKIKYTPPWIAHNFGPSRHPRSFPFPSFLKHTTAQQQSQKSPMMPPYWNSSASPSPSSPAHTPISKSPPRKTSFLRKHFSKDTSYEHAYRLRLRRSRLHSQPPPHSGRRSHPL